MCEQEHADKALQVVQSGGPGEGIPHDVIGSSGTEDDEALVDVPLSQVKRRAATAVRCTRADHHQRTYRQLLYVT